MLADSTDVANQAAVKDPEGLETTYSWFWQIDDMLDYDNIGFCRAAEGSDFKYVTCADCEREPLGVQSLTEKQSLLSVAKVKYADPANTGGHRVMSEGDNAQIDLLVAQQQASRPPGKE